EVAPLARKLTKEMTGMVVRRGTDVALSALAAGMEPTDVAPLANALADKMAQARGAEVGLWVSTFAAMASRLSPADAGPLARALAGRLTGELDLQEREPLARALLALADRLGPADAAFLASTLAEWVLSPDRPPYFERLAYALTERVSDTDRLTQLRTHGL